MRIITLFVVAIVVLLHFTGCATGPVAAPRPGLVNHTVLFKLKDPADIPEFIAACDRLARDVPGIESYYAGRRLEPSRPGTDTSYDVGFFVAFKSTADYQRYNNHPAHVAAIEKWKPRWESIRIFDVVDPTH